MKWRPGHKKLYYVSYVILLRVLRALRGKKHHLQWNSMPTLKDKPHDFKNRERKIRIFTLKSKDEHYLYQG